MHRDVTYRVVHNGEFGWKIDVGSGDKQGCDLTPLYYSSLLFGCTDKNEFLELRLQQLSRKNKFRLEEAEIIQYRNVLSDIQQCNLKRNSHFNTKTSSLRIYKCLRRLLKIRWPDTIYNTNSEKRYKIDELNRQMIKRRKWSWIGHTLWRGNGHAWAEIIVLT